MTEQNSRADKNKGETYVLTLAELKSVENPEQDAVYFVTDPGREGQFLYDAEDTATEEDGGTVFVSGEGARFKRVFDGTYFLDWFGAAGDGETDDTAAIIAADNAANGAIVLFNKTYHYSESGHRLRSQFLGKGKFTNYTGLYTRLFEGTGLDDIVVTGLYVGGFATNIIVEVGPSSADSWRWSADNGETWISDETIVIDDVPIVTPLSIKTTPQALGASGLQVQWQAAEGHTVGDRWNLYTDRLFKRLDIEGLDYRGEPLYREGGTRSVGFGKNVFGRGTSIGNENIGFGVDILTRNVNGFANVAVGAKTMEENTSGNYNSAFGVYTLNANLTGLTNSAFGTYTLADNETGSGNAGFASDALRYNKDGVSNTAVGTQCLYHNVSGNQNTSVGDTSMRGGAESLSNGKSFNYNTAMGVRALYFGGTDFSTAIGHEALYNSKAGHNVGVGAKAGALMENGELNTFIGYEAGLGTDRVQEPNTTGAVCIGAGTAATGDDGIAIGRGVTAGRGQIVLGGIYNQNGVYIYGNFNPQLDSVQNIGTAAGRFDGVYAVGGVITTSDEREKTPLETLCETERQVALEIKQSIGRFKRKSAVEKKGAAARWHFGVGAQTVKAIFEKHGLDGFDYGVLCYDEWEEGDRYSVRYDELSMFILASI